MPPLGSINGVYEVETVGVDGPVANRDRAVVMYAPVTIGPD